MIGHLKHPRRRGWASSAFHHRTRRVATCGSHTVTAGYSVLAKFEEARIPRVRELFLAASTLWVGFVIVLALLQRQPSAELAPD